MAETSPEIIDYDSVPFPDNMDKVSPVDLLQYSFILNPIRLLIIKILNDHDKIVSSELRKMLGISWGKFTTHIDALSEKAYLSCSQIFIDGSPKRVFFIEARGRDVFYKLQKIASKLF
ncbi:MAG: transcriptional regulator [Candidatus Kariarchaeaceae archaeon]|jgi:DNA-binding MarR family transcriptional regulator